MKPGKTPSRGGYTLVEIMVATTILGVVTLGIVTFLFQGSKIYYRDRAALIINRDIRTLTSALDTDAVTSNFFRVYADFSSRVNSSSADAAVRSGEIGDMVVFVFTDPSTTNNGANFVNRLVGYYREVTNTSLNTGPVHRFDVTVSPSVQTDNIGALLNTKVTGAAATYPIVTQIAQGNSSNTDGTSTAVTKLFYNYKNHSAMIAAQISESLNEVQLSTSQMGNTYNFSVSPRG